MLGGAYNVFVSGNYAYVASLSSNALEIVDISLDPAAAVSNNIIAVPTLIKRRPLPEQRFIGDLSETDRLLRGLDVVALPPITPRTVPDARTD